MSIQLVLIDDTQRSWKMDEHTRQLGKRGVSAAREALRSAPRRPEEPAADTHRHAA